MKRAMFFIEGIVILVFLFTNCYPEEVLPIEQTSTVKFSFPAACLNENNENGIWERPHLSQAAYEEGKVGIK
jgi:hypothetical protein